MFRSINSFYAKLLAGKRPSADQEGLSLVDELNALIGEFRNTASAVYEEAESTFHQLKTSDLAPLREAVRKQRQQLTVMVSHTVTQASIEYADLKEEVSFVAVAVYEEAHLVLHDLKEHRIKPIQEAAGEEWQELKTVLSEDEGVLADGFRAAQKLLGTDRFGAALTPKNKRKPSPRRKRAASKTAKRSVGMNPGAIWRSLKQAKELVFDENRNLQFEAMSGPADGSARSELAKAEQVVDRYLKVGACSVAIATIGVLFYAPLKLVSGALILYVAFPVFKGAYKDVFINRRVTMKLLDSVSFLGLIAGGYFLICSVTATIFHASTKMMLKTEDRSRQILANMFGQQPRSVLVLVDGQEVEIPFDLLSPGDTLVVHAGQTIPIDGLIQAGTAAVDQHVLTGEAQPAEKGPGDRVYAATILLAGRIEVSVEKTGADTAAAQIREVLANTTDFRTAIQSRWVKVADRTVLPTLGLSGAALALFGPAGALGALNSNYVAVLKVASPLGMLNYLQRASQTGILIKDGRALEQACKIDTIVFDKTGTLTDAQPHVGEIHLFGEGNADDLLTCAAAVEANQSHPVALAILRSARERGFTLPPLEDARYEIGYGIEARVDGRLVRVGSARYMKMLGIGIPRDFEPLSQKIQAGGSSIVYVAMGDGCAGAIELKPTLRPEAVDVLAELKALGMTLYIISGDHAAPTEALARELGIDHYFAEVLPQDKSRLVEKLQRDGRTVCFVGDGINDAIALKKADVSVSLRGASSLATDTAQIILMDESLRQLPKLFEVAIDYDSNLKTLLTTTFVPGLVSLAGVFFLGTGTGTALLLFNLSMMAGLVNAVWPALQEWEEPAATALPTRVSVSAPVTERAL